MKKFFKYCGVSFLSLVISLFAALIISPIITDSLGSGPTPVGMAAASAVEDLAILVLAFLVIRPTAGHYYLDDSWGYGILLALFELIAWPAVITSLVYVYGFIGQLGFYDL